MICATLLLGKGMALSSPLMMDSVGRHLDPDIRALGTSSTIKRRFGHFGYIGTKALMSKDRGAFGKYFRPVEQRSNYQWL